MSMWDFSTVVRAVRSTQRMRLLLPMAFVLLAAPVSFADGLPSSPAGRSAIRDEWGIDPSRVTLGADGPLATSAPPEAGMALSAAAAAQPAIVKRAQLALRTVQGRYLAPCFRGDHASCRGNMASLLGILQTDHQLTADEWAQLEPVRNNMFFYLVAPSLRLAVAIVKSAGECSEWASLAANAGVSLSQLVVSAAREVGGRTTLPESRELAYLQARVNSCQTGAGNE
ncbi:MAG: hypothetical protein AB7N65_23145 [Vicinamibacterales bacterium]